MATRKLIVNGNVIELDSRIPIALSLRINNISELRDVQASYSNQFVVPDSFHNQVSFGLANELSSRNPIMYRRLPAMYLEDDELIMPDAIVVIDKYIRGVGFYISIYSAISDLFDLIGEKSLKDYDWSEYDFDFTIENALLLNEENGPMVFPLVDWGAYVKGRAIDFRYQYPFIKFSAIFDKILADTGYSYSGEVFSEPRFTEAVLSCEIGNQTNSEDPDFRENNSAKLIADSTYSTTDITQQDVKNMKAGTYYVPGNVKLMNAGPFNPGFYVGTRNKYKFNLMNLLDAETYLGVNYEGAFIGDAFIIREKSVSEFVLDFPASNVKVYQSSIFHTVRVRARIYVQFTDELNNGQTMQFVNPIQIRVSLSGSDATVDIVKNIGVGETVIELDFTKQIRNNEIFFLVLESNVNFRVIKNKVTFVPFVGFVTEWSYLQIDSIEGSSINSELITNSVIPDLKAKDFIKGVANMFGCTLDVSRKNLLFTMFKDIAAATPEDWSSKFDKSRPWEINPRFGNYSQRNLMRYTDDGTDKVGDSSIGINDTVLPIESDLFVLPWSGSAPYLNMVDATDMPPNGNTGIKIPALELYEADVWNSDDTYEVGDIVQYNGRVWRSLFENTGILNQPETTARWELYIFQYEKASEYKPRVAMVRKISESDTSDLVYTDGSATVTNPKNQSLIAYFVDPYQQANGKGDLDLASISEEYYKEISRMLQRAKSVMCYMNLTKADIRKLDFNRPKHVLFFGNNFYLNEVIQYQEGKTTQVNLIRI